MDKAPDRHGDTSPGQDSGGFRLRTRLISMILLLILLVLIRPLLQARSTYFVTGQPEENQAPRTAAPALEREPSLSPSEPTTARQTFSETSHSSEPSGTPSATPSPQTELNSTSQNTVPAAPGAAEETGLWVLSIVEGADTHLFAFHPQRLPLTRLTAGHWDDIHPAASPDGRRVAFASNRDGPWDLYVLEVATGEVTRLTDTAEYEGSPSWSPDGQWLAFERYYEENLEIFVSALEGTTESIRLTEHPGGDFSPAWSPRGRQIAFVSHRSGEPEIWLADLDRTGEDRYLNLSQSPLSTEAHPSWSPQGDQLGWTATLEGVRSLQVWHVESGPKATRYLGPGDWPTWSPDGRDILTRISTPDQTYLTAYRVDTPGIMSQPALAMPAEIQGLTWAQASIPQPLPAAYLQAAELALPPAWLPALTQVAGIPGGRQGLIDLEDVNAPHAKLHDLVDEAFYAFRDAVSQEAGWDFLATLENAFIPLTSSLEPGMEQDWLYTGRGIAFTTVPLEAGWMLVVKEEFGHDTFWRIYLRPRYQDGTQGQPMRALPWDFSTRASGNVQAYERGGSLAADLPAGYWIDLTRLSAVYGWERLPALANWRTFYHGTRLNELVMTDGLDWESAMLELYPPEILITQTPIVPPTRTPTSTPRWYRTPTPTLIPTARPTMTPSPAASSN